MFRREFEVGYWEGGISVCLFYENALYCIFLIRVFFCINGLGICNNLNKLMDRGGGIFFCFVLGVKINFCKE